MSPFTNDLALREAGLRQVTCIVRERQLCFYRHLARVPAEDLARLILSCRDPRCRTVRRSRLNASCLHQLEAYLNDTGMAGLASVPVRRNTYRRKVDAATRGGDCLISDLA